MTVGRFKFVLWVQHGLDASFAQLSQFAGQYELKYYHAGAEQCPTTGKQHLDGYYETGTQRKLKTELNKWNKFFGNGFGDLQIARGTFQENLEYSKKEDGRFETHGEPSAGQGARTDLKEIRDKLTAGETTVDELVLQNPEIFHTYGRTLQKIEDVALRQKFRTIEPRCTWYWGPTGVGKSHIAFKDFDPNTCYVWKNDNGWQDGYTGQGTIILNDYRGSIPFGELLQICDKWPYYVKRRGREPAPLMADTIIFTSSMPPKEIYKNIDKEDSLNQLYRRVTVIHLENRFASMLYI